jgi:hypothetical protein
MKKFFVFLFAIFLAGILAGCKTPAPDSLSGADRDAVLAFSEPMTDNLIAGMTSGDYAVFSRDFDKPMLFGMPERNFQYLKRDRDARLGKYVSRTVEDVIKGKDGYYTVSYNVVYEADKDVVMRVVFNQEEPHLISGLWFNR